MRSAEAPGRASVKFQFRNLGPIKEAELELGELTIVAGRNNTGKDLPHVCSIRLSEGLQYMASCGKIPPCRQAVHSRSRSHQRDGRAGLLPGVGLIGPLCAWNAANCLEG